MHTLECDLTRFHHNGDFSGDVIIHRKEFGDEFTVPFSDLKALVATYVRNARIAALEYADDDDVLSAP